MSAGPAPLDGWYAYDYLAGAKDDNGVIVENVFHPATRQGEELWVDEARWSLDTPESPVSVLALVKYEQWNLSEGVATTQRGAEDLSGSCVTFSLRGDLLDTKGGDVTFWILGRVGQRWHATEPLEVGPKWTTHTLDLAEVEWRRSWSWDPDAEPDLQGALGSAVSYGFAFSAPDAEPTGALGMREFAFTDC